MISRYTTHQFKELWSEGTKYNVWLSVELKVLETLENYGKIPSGTTALLERKINWYDFSDDGSAT